MSDIPKGHHDRTPYFYRTLDWGKCVCGTEMGVPKERHYRLEWGTNKYRFCEVFLTWLCPDCKAATRNGPFPEMPCTECDEKEGVE